MSQITVESGTMIKCGIIIVILLGVTALVFVAFLSAGEQAKKNNDEIQSLKSQINELKVIPSPTPTPAIPQSITFTVLSTSISPNYAVTTTNGQILYCNDYNTWNTLYPENVYSATISGNTISNIVLLRSYYQPQRDYYYYQYPRQKYRERTEYSNYGSANPKIIYGGANPWQ